MKVLSFWAAGGSPSKPGAPLTLILVFLYICLCVHSSCPHHPSGQVQTVQVLTGTGKPWRFFTNRKFLEALRLHLWQSVAPLWLCPGSYTLPSGLAIVGLC